MIHRIFIEHHNEAAIIKTLKAYVTRLERAGKLPRNETLMDERPFSVGAAITYSRKPADKESLPWV